MLLIIVKVKMLDILLRQQPCAKITKNDSNFNTSNINNDKNYSSDNHTNSNNDNDGRNDENDNGYMAI